MINENGKEVIILDWLKPLCGDKRLAYSFWNEVRVRVPEVLVEGVLVCNCPDSHWSGNRISHFASYIHFLYSRSS